MLCTNGSIVVQCLPFLDAEVGQEDLKNVLGTQTFGSLPKVERFKADAHPLTDSGSMRGMINPMASKKQQGHLPQ